MGQPYISVIVTAYNRRKYLPFALRSLEAQTLPKDRFEVIVIKNFDDKESDDIISRNGWKDVYNDDSYHGRKILAGLEESRGDVITFLEDDDMYASNRLEEVYKAFTSYDRLVYFHNSQKIIDEKGNLLERSPFPTSKNLIGGSTIVIDINELQKLAKRYKIDAVDLVLRLRALAAFNSSSESIRRSALEVNAHLLKELPTGVDLFVFASSVKAGGLMYFTDEKLTLYRVHGENWSSSWSSALRLKGGKEMQLRRARALLQSIKAYKLIGSRLLNDDVNRYICLEKRSEGLLLLLPLPELGVLPPELRLSLSDVKLALRCYKVGAIDLVNVTFIMGLAFLSPLLATPRGRLIIGKLAEGVIKALAAKRALRRARLR
ncbi:MAG: glycosyltransferase family 2 protein [Acidilobus sp.]|nr:glycosyltransferase family 2 protein [Acidilobus sp.]